MTKGQAAKVKYKAGDLGGRGKHPADTTGDLFGAHHWPLGTEHERTTGSTHHSMQHNHSGEIQMHYILSNEGEYIDHGTNKKDANDKFGKMEEAVRLNAFIAPDAAALAVLSMAQ